MLTPASQAERLFVQSLGGDRLISSFIEGRNVDAYSLVPWLLECFSDPNRQSASLPAKSNVNAIVDMVFLVEFEP